MKFGVRLLEKNQCCRKESKLWYIYIHWTRVQSQTRINLVLCRHKFPKQSKKWSVCQPICQLAVELKLFDGFPEPMLMGLFKWDNFYKEQKSQNGGKQWSWSVHASFFQKARERKRLWQWNWGEGIKETVLNFLARPPHLSYYVREKMSLWI